MTTYRVTPNDTLFFRGGEPMGMGESHFQTSVFPPSPETFIGAVRTSVIVHKGDSDFEGYKNGKYNDTVWFKEIGFKTLPDTFHFTGPFLVKDRDVCFPPPANLFTDADRKRFIIASPKDFQNIAHSSNIPKIMWIGKTEETRSKDWKPVKGYITLDGMRKYLKGSVSMLNFKTDFIKLETGSPEDDLLYKTEARTGIALKKGNVRTTRSGYLYMTAHKRFSERAGLIFVIEGVPSFPESLIMRLGGENRTVWCEMIPDIEMPSYQANVEFLVTTVPTKVHKVVDGIPVTDFLDEDRHLLLPGNVRSTLISYAINRPELFGGWDLAEEKPKAMVQYVPAGSVFYFETCTVKGQNKKYLLGGNNVR